MDCTMSDILMEGRPQRDVVNAPDVEKWTQTARVGSGTQITQQWRRSAPIAPRRDQPWLRDDKCSTCTASRQTSVCRFCDHQVVQAAVSGWAEQEPENNIHTFMIPEGRTAREGGGQNTEWRAQQPRAAQVRVRLKSKCFSEGGYRVEHTWVWWRAYFLMTELVLLQSHYVSLFPLMLWSRSSWWVVPQRTIL